VYGIREQSTSGKKLSPSAAISCSFSFSVLLTLLSVKRAYAQPRNLLNVLLAMIGIANIPYNSYQFGGLR